MRRFHDLDKVFSEAVADLLRANDGRLFATHAPDAVDRGRMPVTDYYDAGHENCFPGSYQLGGFSIAALNVETVVVTGHPERGDVSNDRECGDSETHPRRGQSDHCRCGRLQ